jgi:predicted hotdog family 3-hydroxylacyl-ACP dehydratase
VRKSANKRQRATGEEELRLEDLLPHRGRMLLVGEVLAVEEERAVTRSTVTEFWPTADGTSVSSLVLLELAAQTAGVCNGYGRIKTRGRSSDQRGWLVGVKKAEFAVDRLPFGRCVEALAENSYSFGNLREVFCELQVDGAVIGSVVLQLFQAEEE